MAPSGSQNGTTLDSFLTVGGGFSTTATGGFFTAGTSSPARNLSVLGANRLAYVNNGGVNEGASSVAAAAAGLGTMVGQFCVTDLSLSWRMGASMRRSDSTVSQGVFEFSIVPAPGAIALLGVAGLSAHRRRR